MMRYSMHESTLSYKRHRFPPVVVAHAVWLLLIFKIL